MNCPTCGRDTRVLDTRRDDDNAPLRRRRCEKGHTFLTCEKVVVENPRAAYDWPFVRNVIIEAAKAGIRPAWIAYELGIDRNIVYQEIRHARENEGVKIPTFKRGNITGVTYVPGRAA